MSEIVAYQWRWRERGGYWNVDTPMVFEEAVARYGLTGIEVYPLVRQKDAELDQILASDPTNPFAPMEKRGWTETD